MRRRLFASLGALVLGVMVAVFAGASPASAATTEGFCNLGPYVGDACFYYLDGDHGAVTGIRDWTVDDVENPWIVFQGCTNNCSGRGLGIGNAAGSEGNGDGVYYLKICVHHSLQGDCDYLGTYVSIFHGGGVTINNERSYIRY